MRNISYEISLIYLKMNCRGNTFSYEWFRTLTRFETEAKVSSEMTCWFSSVAMQGLCCVECVGFLMSCLFVSRSCQEKNRLL